jgi:two-component system, LuxR family, response regulator FixJ
LVCG